MLRRVVTNRAIVPDAARLGHTSAHVSQYIISHVSQYIISGSTYRQHIARCVGFLSAHKASFTLLTVSKKNLATVKNP